MMTTHTQNTTKCNNTGRTVKDVVVGRGHITLLHGGWEVFIFFASLSLSLSLSPLKCVQETPPKGVVSPREMCVHVCVCCCCCCGRCRCAVVAFAVSPGGILAFLRSSGLALAVCTVCVCMEEEEEGFSSCCHLRKCRRFFARARDETGATDPATAATKQQHFRNAGRTSLSPFCGC